MQLSVFQSDLNPEVFGFTSDTAGTNLPADLGPWHKVSDSVRTRSANPLTGHPSSEHVAEGVRRDGYYLARSPLGAAIIGKAETMVSRHAREMAGQVQRPHEMATKKDQH